MRGEEWVVRDREEKGSGMLRLSCVFLSRNELYSLFGRAECRKVQWFCGGIVYNPLSA